jgi:hypothetical protein
MFAKIDSNDLLGKKKGKVISAEVEETLELKSESEAELEKSTDEESIINISESQEDETLPEELEELSEEGDEKDDSLG